MFAFWNYNVAALSYFCKSWLFLKSVIFIEHQAFCFPTIKTQHKLIDKYIFYNLDSITPESFQYISFEYFFSLPPPSGLLGLGQGLADYTVHPFKTKCLFYGQSCRFVNVIYLNELKSITRESTVVLARGTNSGCGFS